MAHREAKGSSTFFLVQSTACLLWKDPETTSQKTNISQAHSPPLRAIERTNISKYTVVHREIKWENSLC